MKKSAFLSALMVVFVLAFTACNKDDDSSANNGNNNNNNNNNNNDPIEQPDPDGMTVKFGTDTWTVGAIQGAYSEANELISFYASKETTLSAYATAPQVYMQTAAIVSDMAYGDAQYYPYAEYISDAERILSDGTYYYGDFWAKSGNMKITAIDLTTMKMSATVNMVMYDAYSVYIDGVEEDAAETKTMTIKMQNVTIAAFETAKSFNVKRNINSNKHFFAAK